MKRNIFQEAILQPEDNPYDCWLEVNVELEEIPQLYARDIMWDGEDFQWTCSLYDQEDAECQVHDFPTEEAIRNWLTEHEVEIDG